MYGLAVTHTDDDGMEKFSTDDHMHDIVLS